MKKEINNMNILWFLLKPVAYVLALFFAVGVIAGKWLEVVFMELTKSRKRN